MLRHKKVLRFGIIVLSWLVLIAFGDFTYLFHNEGIFLLTGKQGTCFEVTDDLLLGQEDREIVGLSFQQAQDFIAKRAKKEKKLAFLELDWNEEQGYGFVRNNLAGGRLLLTNFSRYVGSDGLKTTGIFVGGALPPSEITGVEEEDRHDSGMTYFDSQRWLHIWCNTNEGIMSPISGEAYAPSNWGFLGSKVLLNSDEQILISSTHRVILDSNPLSIERSAYFVAGETYFILGIKITNVGQRDASYHYLYADEPWVGNFGGSAGDAGWIADRRIFYEEVINPEQYSFAGMVDQGNEAIGEHGSFTRAANFIEWLGPEIPDGVFFANQYNGFQHPRSQLVPLSGDARSLGMYWGPRVLRPGQSQTFFLAIGMASTGQAGTVTMDRFGMAESDPHARFPKKPVVRARAEVESLLQQYEQIAAAEDLQQQTDFN
jgi:hypothetical protein